MSLNKPTCVKIKLGDDLRKVQSIPTSLQALRDLIRKLFGSADFHLRYVDEEGDLVTITTDDELLFASQTALGPNLKIVLTPLGGSLSEAVDLTMMSSVLSSAHLEPVQEAPKLAPPKAPEPPKVVESRCSFEGLIGEVGKQLMQGALRRKQSLQAVMVSSLVRDEVSKALGISPPVVHPHVTCDSCGVRPVAGVRYKCTVCRNFDFCDVCEARVPHPHPFFKITDPKYSKYMPRDSSAKVSKPSEAVPKMQMKFLDHNFFADGAEVKAGAAVLKEWRVLNPGPTWPPNVHLRKTKGNINFDYTPVPLIPSGKEGVIRLELKIPDVEGECKAVFRLYTMEGVLFGDKLRVSLRVTKQVEFSCELATLNSMGFQDNEGSLRLLRHFKGDLNKVVARLLQERY